MATPQTPPQEDRRAAGGVGPSPQEDRRAAGGVDPAGAGVVKYVVGEAVRVFGYICGMHLHCSVVGRVGIIYIASLVSGSARQVPGSIYSTGCKAPLGGILNPNILKISK